MQHLTKFYRQFEMSQTAQTLVGTDLIDLYAEHTANPSSSTAPLTTRHTTDQGVHVFLFTPCGPDSAITTVLLWELYTGQPALLPN